MSRKKRQRLRRMEKQKFTGREREGRVKQKLGLELDVLYGLGLSSPQN
jgi:tetrahydromethanopterin S-methyltransferase subunit G